MKFGVGTPDFDCVFDCESWECCAQIEKLKHLLRGHDSSGGSFVKFEPIPCPLDPSVAIHGMDVESATLFKSSLQPCKLAFHTLRGPDYVTIFKHGDDLRQDQLVLQIIQLMDRLLRQENLDLKITPYKVLATGSTHGELLPLISCANDVISCRVVVK